MQWSIRMKVAIFFNERYCAKMENRGLLKAFPKVTRKTEIYRIPRFGVYGAYIELNKIQPFENSNIFSEIYRRPASVSVNHRLHLSVNFQVFKQLYLIL